MSQLKPTSTQSVVAGDLFNTQFMRRLTLLLALSLALLFSSSPLQAQHSPPAEAAAVVNINRADAATLAAGLNGVGLARAEEIVRHREAYGPFVSVEELAEVKGIGPATIDRNRAVITLE